MATNTDTTISIRSTDGETNAETGWNRPRGPRDGGREWCDRHDVDRLLTPFAYRTDPIVVGQKLAAHLDSLRETAATFHPSDAFATDENPEFQMVHYLLELHGAWSLGSPSSTKWVNPNYVHLESFERGTVTDTEERLEILDRLAGAGVVLLADVAPRFGISERSVEKVCERHGFDWRPKRRMGRRRIARTCSLAVEWGHSTQAVADALPRPRNTVYGWMRDHGELDRVPEDPSLRVGGDE
jgi:transposase